jgi:hypothetical protein
MNIFRMKTPHKCPVCNGRQVIPETFYTTQPGGTPVSSGCGEVPCRSCGGTGILWSDDGENFVVELQELYNQYQDWLTTPKGLVHSNELTVFLQWVKGEFEEPDNKPFISQTP